MNIKALLISFVLAFSILGCNSSTSSTTGTDTTSVIPTPTPSPTPAYFPLSVVSPGMDVTYMAGTSFTYKVSGGLPPYTYTLISGPGSITSTKGLFNAGTTPGNSLINITDSAGGSIQATVRITSTIAVNPSVAYLPVSTSSQTQTINFFVTGGVPPYTYEIKSGAGYISSIGAFSAPAVPGTTNILIRDSQGNGVSGAAVINYLPAISPVAVSINRGSGFTFTGINGFPPYTYTVTDTDGNPSLSVGKIDGTTGKLTAPTSARQVLVTLTDSTGLTAKSVVTVVNQPLSVNNSNLIIETNKSFTFVASGGLPPYSYCFNGTIPCELQFGPGQILPVGTYYSPDNANVSNAAVQITDAEGTIVNATIQITNPLTLSPSTLISTPGQSNNISTSGGVPPYSYYVVSGGGKITATSSGSANFQAPNQIGTTVVKVIDAVNTVFYATITINSDVQISPAAPVLSPGNTVTFIGSGGTPPYEYDIAAGPGIMNINGTYTASSDPISAPSSAVVRIRDAKNIIKTATITINPTLSFVDDTISAKTGVPYVVNMKNGVPPYTIRFYKGFSLFASSVSNTSNIMTYLPGVVSEDHSEIIEVRDALGNSLHKTVTIISGLSGYYDPNRSRILLTQPLPANAIGLTSGSAVATINTGVQDNLTSKSSIVLNTTNSCQNFETYDFNTRYLANPINSSQFSIVLNQSASATATCSDTSSYDVLSNNSGQLCPSNGKAPLLNLKTYNSVNEISLSCSVANAPIFTGTCGLVSSPACTDQYSAMLSRASTTDAVDRYLNFNLPDLSPNTGDTVTVEMWFKWNGDRSPNNQLGFNGTMVGFPGYNVSFMTVLAPGNYTTLALCFNTNIAAQDCYGMHDPDALITNRWALFTFVFNNGDVTKNKIYINGSEQALNYLTSSTSDSKNVGPQFSIGSNYDIAGSSLASSYKTRGSLGVVRVYNKTLSPNEIQNNYLEFKPFYFPPVQVVQ